MPRSQAEPGCSIRAYHGGEGKVEANLCLGKRSVAAAIAETMLGGEGTRALQELYSRLSDLEKAAVSKSL
jgi:chemotaxis protein CheY-P-specific phosphatase CheC